MNKSWTLSTPGLAAALAVFAALVILILVRRGMDAHAGPGNPMLGPPLRKRFYLALLLPPVFLFAPHAGVFMAAALLLHASRMAVVLGSLLCLGEDGYTRYLATLYAGRTPHLLLLNAANVLSLALGVLLMALAPSFRSWIFPLGAGIAYTNLLYLLLFFFHRRRMRRPDNPIRTWLDGRYPPASPPQEGA